MAYLPFTVALRKDSSNPTDAAGDAVGAAARPFGRVFTKPRPRVSMAVGASTPRVQQRTRLRMIVISFSRHGGNAEGSPTARRAPLLSRWKTGGARRHEK